MSDRPNIESLKRDAANGHPAAQYNLGVWFMSAADEDRDLAAAKEYFEHAARQEFAPAQSALGYLYLRGQGVAVDAARAAEQFRSAADHSFAEAEYRLGEHLHRFEPGDR